MARLELSANITFARLVESVRDYIAPMAGMWPYYWFKAAAIRDEEEWRLCHFSINGRWSDTKPIREIRDKGQALVAVSNLMSDSEVREMLNTLASDGAIQLLDGIDAVAPRQPLWNGTPYAWQAPVTFALPTEVGDVAEPALWHYLLLSDRRSWLNNDLTTQARIQQAIQPDLDRRSEDTFESFLAKRFAGQTQHADQFHFSDFRYVFDLPLALRVQYGAPHRSTGDLLLTISCCLPLSMRNVAVIAHPFWTSDAEKLSISDIVESQGGWTSGTVSVLHDCGKLWMSFPGMDKNLPYEVTTPTIPVQLTAAIGQMYSKFGVESVAEGEQRWSKQLMVQDGAEFEVALANALARLGVPVLFGGRLVGESNNGGPATPGFDLVALHPKKQLAVVISAKGSANAPGYKEVESLLNNVGALSEQLPGWTAFGILACHAPAERLGQYEGRTDLRVWSREDIALIRDAEKLEAIAHLLWRPPGMNDTWRWAFPG